METVIEELKREGKEKDKLIQELYNKVDPKELDAYISEYKKSKEQ